MATISAAVTQDCKTITLKVSGTSGAASLSSRANGNTAAVTLSTDLILTAGQIHSVQITSNELSGTSGAEFAGVYEFTITDLAGNSAKAYLIAGCELDCCMATFVDDCLTCSCGCVGTSPHLLKANKVFLLYRSALASLQLVVPNYDDSVDKYLKAKSLCTESCDCGC